jgi:hypothetical protein
VETIAGEACNAGKNHEDEKRLQGFNAECGTCQRNHEEKGRGAKAITQCNRPWIQAEEKEMTEVWLKDGTRLIIEQKSVEVSDTVFNNAYSESILVWKRGF